MKKGKIREKDKGLRIEIDLVKRIVFCMNHFVNGGAKFFMVDIEAAHSYVHVASILIKSRERIKRIPSDYKPSFPSFMFFYSSYASILILVASCDSFFVCVTF